MYKGQNAGSFFDDDISVHYHFIFTDQCLNAIAALARSTYNRMFAWLVDLCNRTLIDPTMKKANFIGILDIAGLKYFNSFFPGYLIN